MSQRRTLYRGPASGPAHDRAIQRLAQALQSATRESPPRGWLNVAEVASIVGLSEKTIRRAIDRGELAASKVRNRIRIDSDAVKSWMRENPAPTRAAPEWP